MANWEGIQQSPGVAAGASKDALRASVQLDPRLGAGLSTDAPKAAVLRPTETVSEPSLSVQLTRHDHHNLELKTGFDLGGELTEGQLELYLYFPSNVQVRAATQAELVSDFHSRARLSFPRNAPNDPALLLQEVDSLERLLEQLNDSSPQASELVPELIERVFIEARRVGAIFGETIRSLGTAHQRRIFLTHSRASVNCDPSAELIEVANSITEVATLTDRVRRVCVRDTNSPLPIIGMLSTYASHLLVSYLAGVHAELEKMRNASVKLDLSKYQAGWEALGSMLTSLQSREAASAPHLEDEGERELHLVRLSHMKKFFQSDMFVEVARRQSLQRFSEPAAASAAIFAAIWAAIFQEAVNPQWVHVGFRGVFVICMGIVFYAFRDRLKEILRRSLTRYLAKKLPDVEQDLTAEGQTVGKISEWFAVAKSAAVPVEVKKLRTQACVSEAERHLPEDVLHYRRRFSLQQWKARRVAKIGAAEPTSERSRGWALQEILRINVERHLKHLDDPYKTYSFLDPSGGFSMLRSHRVYHFYACVTGTVSTEAHLAQGAAWQSSLSGPTPTLPVERTFQKFYRIVMDKNGIDRVERVG